MVRQGGGVMEEGLYGGWKGGDGCGNGGKGVEDGWNEGGMHGLNGSFVMVVFFMKSEWENICMMVAELINGRE